MPHRNRREEGPETDPWGLSAVRQRRLHLSRSKEGGPAAGRGRADRGDEVPLPGVRAPVEGESGRERINPMANPYQQPESTIVHNIRQVIGCAPVLGSLAVGLRL